jgi:hypothetical protein
MGVLHVLEHLDTVKEVKDVKDFLNSEIVEGSIRLARYFTGQGIAILDLYNPEETKLTEFERLLIRALYVLKAEVTNGRLPISKIVETYNNCLPEKLRHSPEKVSSLMRKGLGLVTEPGPGNLRVLVWEERKIHELFSKINLNNFNNLNTDQQNEVKEVKVVNVSPSSEIEDLQNEPHSDTCDRAKGAPPDEVTEEAAKFLRKTEGI